MTWSVDFVTHKPPLQAILKRITKVTQPLLQLYVLKVIKSQVPYCGRKWRQCESIHCNVLSITPQTCWQPT